MRLFNKYKRKRSVTNQEVDFHFRTRAPFNEIMVQQTGKLALIHKLLVVVLLDCE